jgi:hypothetical protein
VPLLKKGLSVVKVLVAAAAIAVAVTFSLVGVDQANIAQAHVSVKRGG